MARWPSGDYTVDITGGSLTINSQGDGLDSNGNATITGGTVVVNGPTNDGNGALDVNGELWSTAEPSRRPEAPAWR